MRKLILVIIIFLAGFFRFYQLGENPPSLSWDEAAWGYNAYALGIDGRDEFGRFLPYDYLESFGDFKPPMYAYLAVIPIKLFGLTEFAVRFPSALLGTLTVLITYFLVVRIFWVRRTTLNRTQNHAEIIALLAAFFLAISPWHINLSRIAFEANVATFFLVVGVWLFLTAVAGKKWYLILSIASFILSIYTFNTARVVAPLLILALATGFRNTLLAYKKEASVAFVTGFLLLLPTLGFLFSPQAKLRFEEVNIFSDLGVIERTNQQIENDGNAWWSKIVHNRRLAFGVEYLRHYIDHFNPGFLFIKGDGNPKFSTQDVGQMYLFELPFFVAGILFLLRVRPANWWVIPIWLLLGIVPAATARETPHALRIETTLPTFQILVAYGIVSIVEKFKIQNSKFKITLLTFTFLLLTFNFLYYYHGYYTHYPREYSGEWQYGYKESISYIQSVENDFDKIFFTDVIGRPYIYTLFYTKEDPNSFRDTSKVTREAYGFVHVESYGKYLFPKGNENASVAGEKILYIDTPDKMPINASLLKTFYLLNGDPILVAYTR